MDNVIRGFVHLALHLDRLLLVLGHFDPKDPEVGASEIQSDEITFFCYGERKTNKHTTKGRKRLQTDLGHQASMLTVLTGLELY